MRNKILSYLLILAMLVCVFSSCDLLMGNEAGSIITAAEEQTDALEHTVNIAITFTSDDEHMQSALSSLDTSSITLQRKGDDVKIDLVTSFGDVYANSSYVIVGDMLYNNYTANLGWGETTRKQKAPLTAENKASIVDDAGAGKVLSYDEQYGNDSIYGFVQTGNGDH